MAAFKDLRAYLAGLGTTALLGVGAAILLLTVTSLVAFSAWSSLERADGVGDLTLEEAPASQRQAGPPRPRAAAAAANDAPDVSARAPGATREPPAPIEREPLRPVPSTTPRFDDIQPTPPVDPLPPVIPPPAGPSSPPPVRPTAPDPLLGSVTDDLGTTTQDLSSGLGGVVGQVDPQLGKTVDDTGNALGDVIRGLGQPY